MTVVRSVFVLAAVLALLGCGGKAERGGLAGAASTSTTPLTYHGGYVMASSSTLAIYWAPPGTSFAPGFTDLLNRYFTDVAADSGKTTNVFSVLTQYPPVRYEQSFAAGYLDTAPIPGGQCSLRAGMNACVRGPELKKEMIRVRNLLGLAPSTTRVTMVFFANGFDVQATGTAYVNWCGLHDFFKPIGETVYTYYGMVLYPGWQGKCPDAPSYPNGNLADGAASVSSHEQAEIITDPALTGYNGGLGSDEVADRCGRHSGVVWPVLGTTGFGNYDQLINGNFYNLQGEWSNATGACAWSYG